MRIWHSTYNSVALQASILLRTRHVIKLVQPGCECIRQSSGLRGFVTSDSGDAPNALGNAGLFGHDEVLDLARSRHMAREDISSP